jgi:cytochrome c-type biogenesis protein CcmH
LGHLTRNTTRSCVGLLALTLLLLISGAASAEPWSYDLAGELMSPYCPGRTVSSCPSPQAAELVQWMLLQESGGATREEVIAMLVERFGEEILGAPPAKGSGLWAYILPIAGFVGFGGIAVLVLRRIVGAKDESGEAAHVAETSVREPGDYDDYDDDDELARLVDADLAARG